MEGVMSGIGVDHMSVARRVPIDAEALARVVARLRLDTDTPTVQWSLGERGSCEVETAFAPFSAQLGIAFTTTGVLWDAAKTAPARIEVTLVPLDDRETELEIAPADPVGDWWSARLPAYRDLADAAAEELAQELLWHQSRVAAGL
jgi:hypothetical protein